MQIAFIMNPLEAVNAHKDTTWFLMLAAGERGHRVFYLDQTDLYCDHRTVRAPLLAVEARNDMRQPFVRGERRDRALSEMDVVMVRTDPPFDRRYLYATLLLDLVGPPTRVVNSPAGLRDWNEKLAALHYPEYCPPTLVAREPQHILAFLRDHGRVVLKPVDGHGGEGIVFLDADKPEAHRDIAEATAGGSRWVVVQRFLEAAREGDKRILLLNGEPLGAVLRVHAEGVELNNLDAGGSAHPAALDERDRELCRAIAPQLKKRGIVFCGIDVIGGLLMEINVTSPTCLQELCRFSGEDHHHRIIEALE